MYVVFEGLDGVGKSTQIKLLKAHFKQALFSYEPGASELGKHLRKLLLTSNNLSKRAEVLLFLADRAEHFEKIIKPNIDKLIISDRSLISGIAYANESFDFQTLFDLNCFALDKMLPQKCVFLKADEALLEQRLKQRSLDAIEQRGLEYLLKVQGFFEQSLAFMQEHFALKLLSLNAAENVELLHHKIKDFIND